MPPISEDVNSPEQMSFYQGVMRHFEGDRIFHSSEFFHTETAIISRLLQQTFHAGEVDRSFFVAHIAFELILDKILIQTHEKLAADFYAHLERFPVSQHVEMAEWITQVKLPAYGGFLDKFFRKKYIYSYKDWDHVTYVLRRIMLGVGITSVSYLHSDRFLEMIIDYERELSSRCFDAFDRLNEQLYPIHLSR